YSGARYPHDAEEQRAIRSQHYNYHPHETETQQYWEHDDRADDARPNPHEQTNQNEQWQTRESDRHDSDWHDNDRHADQHDKGRHDNGSVDQRSSGQEPAPYVQHQSKHADQGRDAEHAAAAATPTQDERPVAQGKGHDKKPPPDKKQ